MHELGATPRTRFDIALEHCPQYGDEFRTSAPNRGVSRDRGSPSRDGLGRELRKRHGCTVQSLIRLLSLY